MKDHAPVSHADMQLGADYIATSLSEGKVLLVHCLAGKGRTGSVLAAYMMAYEGKTAQEALDELRAKRPGSVEFPQQQNVLEFEGVALKEWSSRA